MLAINEGRLAFYPDEKTGHLRGLREVAHFRDFLLRLGSGCELKGTLVAIWQEICQLMARVVAWFSAIM
jgi:hypothetical protein